MTKYTITKCVWDEVSNTAYEEILTTIEGFEEAKAYCYNEMRNYITESINMPSETLNIKNFSVTPKENAPHNYTIKIENEFEIVSFKVEKV